MSSNATRRLANPLHESQQQLTSSEYYLFNSINGTTTINSVNNRSSTTSNVTLAHNNNHASSYNYHNNEQPLSSTTVTLVQNKQQQDISNPMIISNVSASSLLMLNPKQTNHIVEQQQHAKHDDSPSPNSLPKVSKLDSIINRLKTNKSTVDRPANGPPLLHAQHTNSMTNSLPQSILMKQQPQRTAPMAHRNAQTASFPPYQMQQVANNRPPSYQSFTSNFMVANRNNRIVNNQATQTLISAGTLEVSPGPIDLKPDLLKDLKSSVNNHTLDVAKILTTIIGRGKSNDNFDGTNTSATSMEKNLFVNDELFKKQLQRIDSEIKMIAAHSKNKLYSLNSFPSLNHGSGPSKPSDLPPTLPPPPPWIPKRHPGTNGASYNTIDLSKRTNSSRAAFIPTPSSASQKCSANNNMRRQNQAQSLLAHNGNNRQCRSTRPQPTEIDSQSFVSKIRVDPKNSLNVTMTYTNRSTPYTRPLQQPVRSCQRHEPILSAKSASNNKQTQSRCRQDQAPTLTISSSIVKVVVPPVKCANLNSQNDCQDQLSIETTDDLRKEYNDLNEKLQEFQNITSVSFKESKTEISSQEQFIDSPDSSDIVRSLRDSSSSPNENIVQPPQQGSVKDKTLELKPRIYIPTFKVHRDGIISMPTKGKQEMIIATSFGLQLSNNIDREHVQLNNETMDVDQFASCLNLVRRQDFEREKEYKEQNHTPKLRMPIGQRPLRLRRLRKDQFNVPASVSYKAARKLGLK